MLKINDPTDLEIVNPTCYIDGYFYSALDSRIAVSKDGVLLNIKTGKVLKQHLTKVGNYKNVVISSPGTPHKGYKVHRLIAATFIGRPSRHLNKPFDELEVNHIDGNGLNNSLDNLEWVTGHENVLHSYASGFNPLSKEVQVRNNVTGVIKLYVSARVVGRIFEISHGTLFKHLNSPEAGRFDYSGYSYRWASNDAWPHISRRKRASITLRGFNKKSGELHCFESIRNASIITGISYKVLWKFANRSKPKYENSEWVITNE